MASVGAMRPSVGLRSDTSTSGDAGHLPNQMSNMSIRDDQVMPLECLTTSPLIIVFWQLISS
jgi:hypothetical protein